MSGQPADEPRRNKGGNPYIPKSDGDAAVQAYIDAMPDWRQAVGRELDALVTQAVPGVRKAVRWNTPFYGIEDQGWFFAMYCMKKYVQVTFFKGTELDPVPPKGSKVPGVRYAHIHEGEAIDEALWTRWITQAAALPGEPVF